MGNRLIFFGCSGTFGYKFADGMKVSTTGNIYGVYDMSGGSGEYISTYINDNTSDALNDNIKLKALKDADSKYKEEIPIQGSSGSISYINASTMTQGLAIHEVSTSGGYDVGWYTDTSYFLIQGYQLLLEVEVLMMLMGQECFHLSFFQVLNILLLDGELH